jgi:hypothetical protein
MQARWTTLGVWRNNLGSSLEASVNKKKQNIVSYAMERPETSLLAYTFIPSFNIGLNMTKAVSSV